MVSKVHASPGNLTHFSRLFSPLIKEWVGSRQITNFVHGVSGTCMNNQPRLSARQPLDSY